MGANYCSRYGCERVMCDRYSSEHGCICDECFDELVSGGIRDVATFMDAERAPDNHEAVESYYDMIFPLPNGE